MRRGRPHTRDIRRMTCRGRALSRPAFWMCQTSGRRARTESGPFIVAASGPPHTSRQAAGGGGEHTGGAEKGTAAS